jgi:predicted transcriptional regulator
MSKNFAILRAQMSPQAQKKAQRKTKEMLAEMPLQELRQARGLSQKTLADTLQVQQPSIARLEKRTDMYLSTLRNHIEAMGGELEVIARFPDGAVKIKNFSMLNSAV